MLWRKSRTKRAKRAAASRLPSGEEVRGQVADLTDDLGEALESARDAITRAMSSAGRRGAEAGTQASRRTAELGKEVGRKGAAAGGQLGRKARKRALEVAREAVDRLPEPEQVAELTRRAEEKLLPEKAKQFRKARRKRARRRLYGAGGVAGLGVLLGWLTAPKKGDEVRQALKERGSAASQKVAEMRAGAAGTGSAQPGTGLSEPGASGTAEPKQADAEVTPIHQGDGATTSKRT
jgi:hypothetical protein